MARKKILFYTDCFIFGGCERPLFELISSLNLRPQYDYLLIYRFSKEYKDGVSTFFPSIPQENLKEIRLIDINTLNLYVERLIDNTFFCVVIKKTLNLLFKLLMPLIFVYDFTILYFIFLQENAEIIHVNNGGYPGALSCRAAVVAAKSAGVKHILLNVHNMARKTYFVFDWLIDYLVRECVSLAITGSNACGLALISNRGFDKNKIINIYHGIRQPLEFHGSSLISGLYKSENIISMVARFEERKAHKYVILALKKLIERHPEYINCKLLFIGDGPLLSQVKNLVLMEGIENNVVFLGYKNDYINYVASSLFLLNPSLGFEDMPYVILEAMSMGIPVIGTDVSGIPEEIENNTTGIIIPPGDIEALYRAMVILLSDKKLRLKMGEASKKRYLSMFTQEKMVESYMKLYGRLISRNQDTKPAVSIIMTVFNQERFVASAIESVLKQSFHDWELIVCDDGSSDGSYGVIERYRNIYPQKIKILRNEINLGVGKARNMALNSSSGDFVAFLDSDDWWESDKIEKQLARLEGPGKIGCVFTMTNVVKDGYTAEKDRLIVEAHLNKLCNIDKSIKERLIKENNICFSSLMITRKAIETVGGFDENLSFQVEDWLLLLKTAYLFRFNYIPEKLTNYRLHKDSYTARVFLREGIKIEGIMQVNKRVIAFAVKHLLKVSSSKLFEKIYFILTVYYYTFQTIVRHCLKKIILYFAFLNRAAEYLRGILSKIKTWRLNKMLILYITSKCNSKCNTCFYRDNLNKPQKELSLSHIEAIINSLPKTLCLLITGGEPFLREDLKDILMLTSDNSNVLSVAINTNGTRPDYIYSVMHNLLSKRRHPKLYQINVSLDSFRDTHNRIRGVDCYDSAVMTLNKISGLRNKFKNFRVAINTVISKDNIEEIYSFANYFYENMDLDFHYFEIIRGDPKLSDLLLLEDKKIKNFYDDIVLVQEKYFRKQRIRNISLAMKRLRHIYWLQYKNYFENMKWDINCLAGKKTFVIYEDGKFSICELREPILGLSDFSFNVKEALNSRIVKDEIRKTKSANCFCTHGCFIANSL